MNFETVAWLMRTQAADLRKQAYNCELVASAAEAQIRSRALEFELKQRGGQ